MNHANSYQPTPFVKLQHPEWTKNATLYQINTRQFSAEGTFRAAEKQLTRLRNLGIDIVWLMPIHEIGLKNRKGSLGSPYSVKIITASTPSLAAWRISSISYRRRTPWACT
jgi:hypothetical protein